MERVTLDFPFAALIQPKVNRLGVGWGGVEGLGYSVGPGSVRGEVAGVEVGGR